MNTLVFAFVLLQSVVSLKPGFVHFADGKTNVRRYQQLRASQRVETGAQSGVEIGLGADARMRLDENSAAVLESVDKEAVSVRLESGMALVEITKIDKPNRISIAVGDLKTVADSKGLFRFSPNAVTVVDGKLKIERSGLIVEKGAHVTESGSQSKVVVNTPSVFKSFTNSPKAGFVNAVEGQANVKATEVARSDQPVQTGPLSYVELLLRPGAFLRVNENSSVVLESTGLNDVVVRVASGDALIENIIGDPRMPIRVNVDGVKTIIATAGLYRFTNDTASVIEGVLRIGKKDATASTGMRVRYADKQYETSDLDQDAQPNAFDRWSAQRSHLLARANLMADFADSDPNFFLFLSQTPLNAVWMYTPSLNGFTFMPLLDHESHYGNTFSPLYTLLPTSPPGGPARIPPPMPLPAPNATPATASPDRAIN